MSASPAFPRSAVVFGVFFYQSRQTGKTIAVVGAATTRVDSDVVKWRVTITRSVGASDVKSVRFSR